MPSKDERTIRDALLDAHRAVGLAEAQRSAVLTAARHAGLSLRTIGEVIGVAPSTVMRWTDNGEEPPTEQGNILAWPASMIETEAGCATE